LARSTILVTSNFELWDVIHNSDEANVNGKKENINALYRRFWHINVNDFMRVIGLKLLPKYEINMLKKQGNTNPSLLFMSWDYTNNCPTGIPMNKPEHYQQLIKDAYYK
jgi:hypothetical protein